MPLASRREVAPAIRRQIEVGPTEIDVAESILASALRREESRGAHQRTDHPQRDDERFLVHHLVRRGADGAPTVEQVPVTITALPPGERVYGR